MNDKKKKNPKYLNNQKFKYNSLLHALDNYGFTSNQSIDQDELRLFLNNKSPSGYFDSILCEQLFKFIKINENENSSISIPEFIKGFLLFEKDLKIIKKIILLIFDINGNFIKCRRVGSSLL